MKLIISSINHFSFLLLTSTIAISTLLFLSGIIILAVNGIYSYLFCLADVICCLASRILIGGTMISLVWDLVSKLQLKKDR